MAELGRKEKTNAKQGPKPRLGDLLENIIPDKELRNLVDAMRDSEDETPPHNRDQAFWAKARELVEMGANPDIRDTGFDTLLTNAAKDGETEMCRFLLENGAKADLREDAGRTALMNAAWHNHPETCRILLENGANLWASHKAWGTAVDHARTSNSMDAYYLLWVWTLKDSMGLESAKDFVEAFRECLG